MAEVSQPRQRISLRSLWFSPRGRIPRKDFWLRGILPPLVVVIFLPTAMAALLITQALAGENSFAEIDPSTAMGILLLMVAAGIIFLALTLSAMAVLTMVGIKRLHDLGLSGWYMAAVIMTPFIPYFGLPILVVCLIYLGCREGQPERNKYGLPPE